MVVSKIFYFHPYLGKWSNGLKPPTIVHVGINISFFPWIDPSWAISDVERFRFLRGNDLLGQLFGGASPPAVEDAQRAVRDSLKLSRTYRFRILSKWTVTRVITPVSGLCVP